MDYLKDKRFSQIATDVRFRPVPKGQKKVKIDDRFKSMFSDERFKLKYTVDKRGKPCDSTTSNDLRKFYDLSSDSEDSSEDNDIIEKTEESHENELNISPHKLKDNIPSHESDDESEIEECVSRKREEDSGNESDISEKYTVDFARGEGSIESSSSDDSSDLDYDDASNIEHPWGEIDVGAPEASEITRRLAVCNMDWDRIKAEDLFILFNSFKPSNGVIYKVSIYPSEFGLNHLKEEEIWGPSVLREISKFNETNGSAVLRKSNNDEKEKKILEETKFKEEEEDDGDDKFTKKVDKVKREKFRQYQLKRLKYFYAVVECDTSETANTIYTECDGREFEGSGIKMDLRFVPESMEFEQKPTSEITEVNDPSAYEPLLFVTSALQQSKVNFTWDETNYSRRSLIMKKFKEEDLEKSDLQIYLASSSDEDECWPVASIYEEDEGNRSQKRSQGKEDYKEKYHSLLKSIEDTNSKKYDKTKELEITWEPGLEQASLEVFERKKNEHLSPWEQFLQKKKDKKKNKRISKKQNTEQTQQTFSDDEVPSDINLNDPYFKENFGPEFTDNTGKSKRKRTKKKMEESEEETEETLKNKAELELLLMENEDRQHFNLDQLIENNKSSSKWKRKLKKKQKIEVVEDNFKVDVCDDRFSALYTSSNFHIDPSHSQFKKTKGMEEFIEEKLRRINSGNDETTEQTSSKSIRKQNKSKFDSQLSQLVTSIKSATSSHRKYKT